MKSESLVTVVLIMAWQFSEARVVRVPEDATTIQRGLDSLTVFDTLFVACGVYEELLQAPAISFTLLGEINPDSAEITCPFVNASNLEARDTTAVLLLPEFSSVTIENFRFQNGTRNGIRSWADSVTMRNCIMDSAYYGFRQMQDSSDAVVTLEDCEFRGNRFMCVQLRRGNFLSARRCNFTGVSGNLRTLVYVTRSEINECKFSGNDALSLLTALLGPHVITNCVFGPAQIWAFETAVSLGGGAITFSNNTIMDCVYGHHAVRVSSIYPDSIEIRDNTFVRCRGLNVGLMAAGALGTLYGEAQQGQGALITGNTFMNCVGFVVADDIWPSVGYPALIENNRFVRDSLNGLPSIGGSGSQWQSTPITLRNNHFENCGYALDGSAQTDAQFNFWGQDSGPYHETDNPQGVGDTITGPVQFIPWLNDTTISETAHQAVVVDEYALGIFPNPFNSTVMIEYSLVREQDVTMEIFDVLGRNVKTLFEEKQTIGVHQVQWNAEGTSSGIYFARLFSADHSHSAQTAKLMLLK